MVALRDGRKLIGVLRSWDQFGMEYATDTGHERMADAGCNRKLGASGYP
jgi:small nuclear ribonucleoprotein (snRNP)-like protein